MEVREPPASYAEYRLLPDDAPRYEILEGVGQLTPSPTEGHQSVLANIGFHLYQHVYAHSLGKVYYAPFDVVLSEYDVVQPDLLFVSRERHGILQSHGVFGPPDLVVEVLSRSTAQRDLQWKLPLYQRHGVRECWVVDLDNRTVDVWYSNDSPLDARAVVVGDGGIESRILPGLSIPLSAVFAGLGDIQE